MESTEGHFVDIAMILGLLDDLAEQESSPNFQKKNRIEERLPSEISEFATTSELLDSVGQFRPVFAKTNITEDQKRCADRQWWRHIVEKDYTTYTA